MDDRTLYAIIGAFLGLWLRDLCGSSNRGTWAFVGVQIVAVCYLVYAAQVPLLYCAVFAVTAVGGWFPYKLWLNWRETRKAKA